MLLLEDVDDTDIAVDELVDAAEHLGMFPAIAREVRQLTQDPGASASDLENVVSRDVALTALLLRLANSPYYGGRRTVTTLRHAVVVIGFVDTCQMAIVFAMSSVDVRGEAAGEVMRHGARSGLVARELARHTRALEPSEAFVAGILHDLGSVVLLQTQGAEYEELVCRSGLSGSRLLRAERELVGVDHATLVERCLMRWRFSYSTTLAVRHHHQPLQHAGFDRRPAFCGDSLLGLTDWVETALTSGVASEEVVRGIVLHPFNQALEITEDRAQLAVTNLELEFKEVRH